MRSKEQQTTEDRLILEIVDLKHRVDHIEDVMFTKDDARAMENRLMKGQDTLIRIVTRIEQEMAAWKSGFTRHEERIHRLEKHTGLV